VSSGSCTDGSIDAQRDFAVNASDVMSKRTASRHR
jgi:hypothetical protein